MNTNVGFVSVYKIDDNNKIIVKDKIIKILIRAWINNIKKILTWVLFCRKKDINDAANSTNINKMIAVRSFKAKISV